MSSDINLSRIKLVSWDVDGTLFSYKELILQLLSSTFRRMNVMGLRNTAKCLTEIFRFHHKVEAQRLSSECRVINTELDQYEAAKADEKEAIRVGLSKIAPRTEAIAMIEQFAAAAIVQVALSDFECDYKLDALRLSHHFKKAYACERIGYWKPSPIPLAQIQRDFGIDPQEHLHIGDRSSTDGLACARNGCHFLSVKHLITQRLCGNR